jgi:hypothetical protein
MRGTRLLKGVKPHDRANGYAVLEIGCLVLGSVDKFDPVSGRREI